jgi:hypothetical protein
VNWQGNQSTERQPASVLLCPPQIPFDLTLNWTSITTGSFHYYIYIHTQPPLDYILSKVILVCIVTPVISLESNLVFLQLGFRSGLFWDFLTKISFTFLIFHMPCPSHFPSFHHPDNVMESETYGIHYPFFSILLQHPCKSKNFFVSILNLYCPLRAEQNSMETTPCWEASSYLATQEIPGILLNLKVLYHVHKSPLVSIVSQMTCGQSIAPQSNTHNYSKITVKP